MEGRNIIGRNEEGGIVRVFKSSFGFFIVGVRLVVFIEVVWDVIVRLLGNFNR